MQFSKLFFAGFIGASMANAVPAVTELTSSTTSSATSSSSNVVDIKIVNELLEQVTHVETTVSGELKTVTEIVGNVVEDIELEKILGGVKDELSSVLGFVNKLVGKTVLPLVQGELEAVFQLLGKVQLIVKDVEGIVSKVLTIVQKDVLKAVKAELQAVLEILKPICDPITGLVHSLLGDSKDGLVAQIEQLLKLILGLVGNQLDPLIEAVATIA